MTGFIVTGFIVTGFIVTGFTETNFAKTDFKVTDFKVTDFTVPTFILTGDMYLMASSGHAVIQLKHPTHLEKSTFWSLIWIQLDLHTIAHFPHCVHKSVFILIRKTDIREISPRRVPTGQMVLQ